MKVPSVKGFHDILPGESERWSGLETTARGVFGQYNFHEIRIPIVERAELFRRSVGETSDIVEKEMYTFDDRDGTPLTLRPEGTASVVRAYVDHGMHVSEPVAMGRRNRSRVSSGPCSRIVGAARPMPTPAAVPTAPAR